MRMLTLGIVLTASLFAQSQPAASDAKPDALPYVLAPGDYILIRAAHAEKLSGRTFHIQPDGFVTLPTAGRLQAGGLTVQSLEKEVAKRLRRNADREPEVVILVVSVPPQSQAPAK
jgi:protein involved in polysaccharide export with SLBB domain